jgi:ATP/ADP translocase
MMGHSILETVRDTLFLSRLPAQQLPWAYIIIALLALVASFGNRRALERFSRRRVLASTLSVGGIVTAAFQPFVESKSAVSLFSLYVWTGLLATVVVVQFWLLAARVFDVGQAKRVFAFVAAGGLVGAALGSAVATLLLLWLPPRHLLLASGATFVITAVVSLRFSMGRLAAPARRARRRLSPLGVLKNEPYLKRVFWSVLLSTVVFTGVDYVFKTMVSIDVGPEQLGLFFGRFYMVVNATALVVQLLVAPRLLRVLGVNGSLLLLPTILLVGAGGFVLTLGLGSILALRATDGAFRHSLYRTSMEILYLPLSSEVRDRFKAIAESVGQRGGQALASLMILGAVAAHSRPAHLAVGLAAVTLLWVVLLSGLKPHYLDLFRRNLRQGSFATHAEVRDLDLHSLEALIAALSSENDDEVTGALEILAAHGKANLIPALILYHPSPDVVLHAFELLSGTDRADVHRLTERLLKHENPRIRAAALRVHAAQAPERALLEDMAHDASPLVRTTAMVQSIRAGFVDEWEGGDRLRQIIDGPSPEMRMALAYASRDLPPGRYAWALIRLAGVREPGLSVAVARSMAAAPDLEFLPTLVRMLADRDCRDAVRAAVVALGDEALGELEKALADTDLPRRVRRHLPRTISRFVGNRAAKSLMRQLLVESDEVVVLKILRGLGRMRETDPSVRVSRAQLLDVAVATLGRAITLLHWRVGLDDGCRKAGLGSPAIDLLSALLADKEQSCIERVFRILQILDPGEEFRNMYSGLRSADRRVRADSRELLSNVVPDALRVGLLALVDEASDAQRLRAASAFFDPPGRSDLADIEGELDVGDPVVVGRARAALATHHVRCLKEMLADPNEALRSVAGYRVAELGDPEQRDMMHEMNRTLEGALSELTEPARGGAVDASPEVSGAE